jgi:hypothetical protein
MFGPVFFKMNLQLACVDSTKNVYGFTAILGKNPHEDRIALLILALRRHGECVDCAGWENLESALYRL